MNIYRQIIKFTECRAKNISSESFEIENRRKVASVSKHVSFEERQGGNLMSEFLSLVMVFLRYFLFN